MEKYQVNPSTSSSNLITSHHWMISFFLFISARWIIHPRNQEFSYVYFIHKLAHLTNRANERQKLPSTECLWCVYTKCACVCLHSVNYFMKVTSHGERCRAYLSDSTRGWTLSSDCLLVFAACPTLPACSWLLLSVCLFTIDDTGCPSSQSVSPSKTPSGSEQSAHGSPVLPERKAKVKRVRVMAEWSGEPRSTPRHKREQRSAMKARGKGKKLCGVFCFFPDRTDWGWTTENSPLMKMLWFVWESILNFLFVHAQTLYGTLHVYTHACQWLPKDQSAITVNLSHVSSWQIPC